MHEQLQALVSRARFHNAASKNYAGDVSAAQTWEYIITSPAYIIDVRTAPEWKFSGVPDVRTTHATLLCVEWLRYPDFEANPRFMEEVRRDVKEKEAPLFFLCKTGGRSLQAALQATSEGYIYSFNITHGFEGDHNVKGQRGCVNGWKAEGLAWNQA